MLRPLVALSVAIVACGGTGKRETSALVSAVDRYRRSDNASKVAEVQKVADVACSHPRVCDAKRACLAAMGPTARALAVKEEVARRLADIEEMRLSVDASDARGLPAKLDEAERLLNEGRSKMPDCEKQLTDLVVEHGG
ncbi:MAG: hypothetical protein M3O46_07275 [Myxococcota bacterium]|nr:hypothetical protein [Myxococcota bacterium]